MVEVHSRTGPLRRAFAPSKFLIVRSLFFFRKDRGEDVHFPPLHFFLCPAAVPVGHVLCFSAEGVPFNVFVCSPPSRYDSLSPPFPPTSWMVRFPEGPLSCHSFFALNLVTFSGGSSTSARLPPVLFLSCPLLKSPPPFFFPMALLAQRIVFR